jgi:hypothetical protein
VPLLDAGAVDIDQRERQHRERQGHHGEPDRDSTASRAGEAGQKSDTGFSVCCRVLAIHTHYPVSGNFAREGKGNAQRAR